MKKKIRYIKLYNPSPIIYNKWANNINRKENKKYELRHSPPVCCGGKQIIIYEKNMEDNDAR